MIAVGERKIIKAEDNIASVCFGLKKRLGTILRCISSSNSDQPFPPPCFVQKSVLSTARRK